MSRLLQQQQQLEAKRKVALQAATINLLKHFGCMMLQYGLFQVKRLSMPNICSAPLPILNNDR